MTMRILQAADNHRLWVRKCREELTMLRKHRRQTAELWIQTTENEHRTELERIDKRIVQALEKQLDKTGVEIPIPEYTATDEQRQSYLNALLKYTTLNMARERGDTIEISMFNNSIRRILKFEALYGTNRSCN